MVKKKKKNKERKKRKICLPIQEMQKMSIQSLGGEDPLEKEMVTHFSIPVWKITLTEEPCGLQFIRSQKSQT